MNSASLAKKVEQQRASTLIDLGCFSTTSANAANPATENLNSLATAASNTHHNHNNNNNLVFNQTTSVKISSNVDGEEQEVDIEDLDEEERTTNHQQSRAHQARNNGHGEEADEDEEEDSEDDEDDNENEDDDDDDDEDDRLSNDRSQSRDSSNVNSSNADAEYPVTFSRKSKYNFDLNDNILYQDVLQVNCNSIVAELHKKKFGSGGKGHCVRCQVSADDESVSGSVSQKIDKWMTPIEFENHCGKGNCRDWKRTIKVGGQPLLALLDARILICHAVSCSCGICNRNETLVGPIRPFMKYRRRKRDEILAQNAYKKFLSLKPPTLLHDTLSKFSSSNNNNNNNNNNNSNSNLGGGNQNNNNNNSSNSNSSTNSSNGSVLATPGQSVAMTTVTTTASPVVGLTVNAAPSILNVPSTVGLPGYGVQASVAGEQDLVNLVRRMQESEEKKWSSLEKVRIEYD
jgi:hypothetical protein